MPVYNREKYIRDAVLSILTQSFIDFEFIIIDDGSTDSTYEILKSFNDKRIKLLRKNTNGGNYSARNEGMNIATGKYICVMDSDDIALPNRIQKQYDFMEKNNKFGLCGSFAQVIDSDEIITAPEDYNEIKVWSMSNIMFRHPTVFIRAEFLKKHNLKYNESYRYAGDYDFLVKAAHLFPVTNIQEVLLQYRRHPEQISTAHKSGQFEIVNKVILKQLMLLKEDTTNDEKRLHIALMNRFPVKEEVEFEQLKSWANHLLELNTKKCIYDSAQLANFLKSLLKFIKKQFELDSKERNRYKNEIKRVNEILNPKFPLIYQKEWTVLPDFTLNLLNIVSENKPSVIVECGSGLSTLILGYLVKNGMVSKSIAIDHNKQFYEATKADLIKHGLEKYVNLIYAPLKPVIINDKEWFWYDTTVVDEIVDQIDILIVDGPPGQIQKHSRYPAIPLLKRYFNPNYNVIADDSRRPDEKEVIEIWLQENQELRVDHLKTVKGMSVLKKLLTV